MVSDSRTPERRDYVGRPLTHLTPIELFRLGFTLAMLALDESTVANLSDAADLRIEFLRVCQELERRATVAAPRREESLIERMTNDGSIGTGPDRNV